ncbi:hypothetical protein Pint_22101 [Pistacia integerrima]|uniref:Uncharacterized protein n=1 Tax=Pistacia integerrima TaxID=434235 RepID=A0ACC0YP48_9ROSI|nr:hypothetical protein Pint_22101 [Pistacia integerrima]
MLNGAIGLSMKWMLNGATGLSTKWMLNGATARLSTHCGWSCWVLPKAKCKE